MKNMAMPEKPARYKKGLMLTKDNKLVRIHGNMTPMSYKLTNYILWMAVKEGRLDQLKASGMDVIKFLHINDNKLGKSLKAECKKAAGTVVEIQSKEHPDDDWTVMNLVPTIEYRNGVLTAEVNPRLAPYINDLRGNFTQLELESLSKCGTYPAMRLYEVCSSWKRAKKVCYSTDEWRGLLGASGKSYQVFSQFKRRAWDPAIQTVNECTDLELTPEYIREGKKTVKILVHIQEVLHAEEGSPLLPASEDSIQDLDLVKRMVSCGFTQKMAKGYIEACGADYCEAQLRLTLAAQKEGQVKNPAGYLRRALDGDYAGEREAIEAIKAAEELARQENARRDREAWELFHGSQNQEQASSFDDDARQAGEKCLALGIDERQIMAWLEKYPSSLLGKAADMAAGMDTKHAVEYMEAILRHSSAKA